MVMCEPDLKHPVDPFWLIAVIIRRLCCAEHSLKLAAETINLSGLVMSQKAAGKIQAPWDNSFCDLVQFK